MLKKDTAKTHYSNAGLNVPDNAPPSGLPGSPSRTWLVMVLKTNSSFVDKRLSKMEASIKNIVSLTVASNLAVN